MDTLTSISLFLIDFCNQVVAMTRKTNIYSEATWEAMTTAAATAAKEMYGDSLPTELRATCEYVLYHGMPAGQTGSYLMDGDGNVTKP